MMPAALAGSEKHPLAPFLPPGAGLLMLGSFPPERKLWSMYFFYPYLQNDMWRIFGVVFFGDKAHFLLPDGKAFDKERIAGFLERRGIALYDTASAVRRLQGNASDKFLEVVEPTDIRRLLERLPACRAVATTGQQATDILCGQLHVKAPPVGRGEAFALAGRRMTLYRMPSSSRAYPLALEKKAEAYRRMFDEIGGRGAEPPEHDGCGDSLSGRKGGWPDTDGQISSSGRM